MNLNQPISASINRCINVLTNECVKVSSQEIITRLFEKLDLHAFKSSEYSFSSRSARKEQMRKHSESVLFLR